jgi:hypothetical protein
MLFLRNEVVVDDLTIAAGKGGVALQNNFDFFSFQIDLEIQPSIDVRL